MKCCSTSTRAPGAARGDVSDSRPDAAGLQRLVRGGSARSIRSSNPGASGASLDTAGPARPRLSRLVAVRAPGAQTAAARQEGRLHVSGVPLLAEATRERRRLETQAADAGLRADRTARFGRRSSAGPSGRCEEPRLIRCAASTAETTESGSRQPATSHPTRPIPSSSPTPPRAGGVDREAATAGNAQVLDFDAPRRSRRSGRAGRRTSSIGSRTLPTDP